jgi:pyruvate dehydrogenase E2 component (dihydrolipoamide acetyltransferase)
MATELKVPSLGMDMEEANIIRWLVEEGDEVEKGDVVLEIDTDKTSFEIESPADGTIRNLSGEAGETVPVGTTLAFITAPGEEVPEPDDEDLESKDEPEVGVTSRPGKAEVRMAPEPAATLDSENGYGTVRASPAARRAAAERDLPVESITGSGPNGRVYLSDVLKADGESPTAGIEQAPPEPLSPEPSRCREPLSRVRLLGGERTARSFTEVPHFYLTRDLEVDRLLGLKERLSEKMEPVPSITDLLALVVSRTLKAHPRLNGRYSEGALEINDRVNLGVAVATGEGLVVPVLREADMLPLVELVPAVKELVRRAREGGLRPEELSGGTFTISNLGAMGIDSFDAIINAPESAVLAVGRVRVVPEWRGGEWVPRSVLSGTLSVDHRTADGADGARFLQDLQAALSDWELLL